MRYADSDFFNPIRKNMGWSGLVDPRTNRFGMTNGMTLNGFGPMEFSPFGNETGPAGWISRTDGTMFTQRNGASVGAACFCNPASTSAYQAIFGQYYFPSTAGWYPDSSTFLNASGLMPVNTAFRPSLLSQNNPNAVNDSKQYDGFADSSITTNLAQFCTDPDGVVRRAAGAYVPTSSAASAASKVGPPMAAANGSYNSGTRTASSTQADSHPIILNRPFRSVAELGYTFSGTPEKNLSFFTPDSGAAPLLDVFCINDTDATMRCRRNNSR